MRKKIIINVFSGVLVAFCFISFSSSGQETVIKDPESGSNTGPAKIVDCRLWFTGDKKVCMSENQYTCTETDCF